ncbi:UDP-N-acetylmuramate dehydrogenase [Solidesulfovibrio carbinolicus]|uniref:UDP-N-acetylenolpyruvoylglucosamine reductase n=1 Tax=Solidesulfovibrio carbinolicus TaxID=296842 RepID=A0A4P6HFF9_9BACT|nr:UDP-N-acetylmuramate dehydrogenase [Solidesulfovibrio carbinolicus]QAZ65833.1 UDP-N-acetylenolpyruvoylglucosamine reductase [Solidesulfovibrio carbinolicus]
MSVVRFSPAWLTEDNSYRVAAWAEACCFPETADDLVAALRQSVGVRVVLLGHGCNVILSRNHYDSSLHFIATSRLEPALAVAGERLRAGAGARLRDVCRLAARCGLSGLERLWDIPGSVGGAAHMNAGAYGASFYDVVESVDVYAPGTGQRAVLSREQCRPAYRMTAFQGTDTVILGVGLKLTPADPAAVLAEMGRIGKLRRSRLPYDFPSAGSVFRRPDGGPPVGQIMEEAGLKGFRIGGAQISPRHAGIIVNAGGATGADILAVIEVMRRAAWQRYGVELVLEQVVV